MRVIEGSITTPKGFQVSSLHAGLKRVKKDLAVIYSSSILTAAGVFTKNLLKAPPVVWSERIVKEEQGVKAMIINSANANACTGDMGSANVIRMADATANILGIKREEVLVFSTGVIGVQLPMEKVLAGIEKIDANMGSSREDARQVAEAIMTTDTYSKEVCIEFEIDGKVTFIGGIAKGSGMIHPNMATMLSFLTTDVAITKELLQKALIESTERTYNMISVDGDTSTNDSAIIVTNGLLGNTLINDENSEAYRIFSKALDMANEALAVAIVKDGEGATKLIEVYVNAADTIENARILAKSVISSNLVKTAIFGQDANWGRIVCALGYAEVDFDQFKIELYFGSDAGIIKVFDKGMPLEFDEEFALKILQQKSIRIVINMNNGSCEAKAWGCDLSFDYVRINGQYRT